MATVWRSFAGNFVQDQNVVRLEEFVSDSSGTNTGLGNNIMIPGSTTIGAGNLSSSSMNLNSSSNIRAWHPSLAEQAKRKLRLQDRGGSTSGGGIFQTGSPGLDGLNTNITRGGIQGPQLQQTSQQYLNQDSQSHQNFNHDSKHRKMQELNQRIATFQKKQAKLKKQKEDQTREMVLYWERKREAERVEREIVAEKRREKLQKMKNQILRRKMKEEQDKSKQLIYMKEEQDKIENPPPLPKRKQLALTYTVIPAKSAETSTVLTAVNRPLALKNIDNQLKNKAIGNQVDQMVRDNIRQNQKKLLNKNNGTQSEQYGDGEGDGTFALTEVPGVQPGQQSQTSIQAGLQKDGGPGTTGPTVQGQQQSQSGTLTANSTKGQTTDQQQTQANQQVQREKGPLAGRLPPQLRKMIDAKKKKLGINTNSNTSQFNIVQGTTGAGTAQKDGGQLSNVNNINTLATTQTQSESHQQLQDEMNLPELPAIVTHSALRELFPGLERTTEGKAIKENLNIEGHGGVCGGTDHHHGNAQQSNRGITKDSNGGASSNSGGGDLNQAKLAIENQNNKDNIASNFKTGNSKASRDKTIVVFGKGGTITTYQPTESVMPKKSLLRNAQKQILDRMKDGISYYRPQVKSQLDRILDATELSYNDSEKVKAKEKTKPSISRMMVRLKKIVGVAQTRRQNQQFTFLNDSVPKSLLPMPTTGGL